MRVAVEAERVQLNRNLLSSGDASCSCVASPSHCTASWWTYAHAHYNRRARRSSWPDSHCSCGSGGGAPETPTHLPIYLEQKSTLPRKRQSGSIPAREAHEVRAGMEDALFKEKSDRLSTYLDGKKRIFARGGFGGLRPTGAAVSPPKPLRLAKTK